ncbi:hypothetical protein GBAR_LOCUS27400 [Geodia barretti]|uniref:Uncharacterized protein n=1 Tax=Geodia barretti TaxID=519541 RepID=A0AA35TK51_GEOBA|nr:hypothetical protein GBAR_LOCUS27400 [Geodia barretti]
MTGVFDWPVIPADPGDDVNNTIAPRRHSGHLCVGIDCNWVFDLLEVGQLRMDILCVHRVHRHVLVIGRHEVEVCPYIGQQEFNLAIPLGAGEPVLPLHDGSSPRRGMDVTAIILPLHRCLQSLGPRLHVMTGVFDWPVIPADPGDDVNNTIAPRCHSGHFCVGIDCNWVFDLLEVGQLRMDILCVHQVGSRPCRS